MPLFPKKTTVIELSPLDFDIYGKVTHPALKGSKKGMLGVMAGYCGYCVRLSPTYNEVSSILGNSFPMFFIDAEKYRDFCTDKLKVQSFPTMKYIGADRKLESEYSSDRTTSAFLQDICRETNVCKTK